MAEEVIVRIPKQLIQQLRELFPELGDESDATVVRIALRKLILEKS
ncbi:hypothetical protein Ferp_0551 [Ferroglobus placidus DSM 10642]|uniref:Uncharacterized protein n=1 Tax=Ferroglobus placidus (strain DSM 10642 / AEDII12DO) TaxID=589924 RepID=D3S391_FERPA|nr:hypothetical protein [Ferroglobus placidus]ADC64724.1 hypothetical protein Ferp_0551 [Ferroglobus placidus DSM 10642]